jgi:hypothetical protein
MIPLTGPVKKKKSAASPGRQIFLRLGDIRVCICFRSDVILAAVLDEHCRRRR